jgi:hypothetical protein
MVGRIVSAARDSVCTCCGLAIAAGSRVYVLGQPGQPPTEELAWDCGEQLRVSLVDQHGREKRRRRL